MEPAMTTLENSEKQAQLLSAALPYMQRYENKHVVVKYGGHAMGNPELGKAFARDIALLKQSGINPIVVHGGGPQIQAMLTKRLARHRRKDRRSGGNGSGRFHQ
jgi:acetylglutamate kinase